ncbi:MAG TPA: hypothetical protein VGC50_02900 [Gammaproteobacteria bacterium]|jgi:hypothetical protein
MGLRTLPGAGAALVPSWRGLRACGFTLALLLLSASVLAQGWRTYVSRDRYFSVNFPDEPQVEDVSYASEYGATLPARVYSVQRGQSLHSVTVVDFTEAQRIYQELPDRTDEANNASLWLYDQRASVAFAARNFRLRGGDVTYDAWHHIDLVEGHQLQITNTDRSRTYASTYFHQGRLYILEATVPPGSLPQGLFQQSLSFLDEDGNRIRYQLFADGSRTRVL